MSDFDPTDFILNLERAERRIRKAAVRAAESYAQNVMDESQELCPVSPADKKHAFYNGHSGQLRDSGVVKDAVVTASSVVVEFGYNTDYAAAVHERLDANHKYPGAVNARAQAKYLETPIRAAVAGFGPYLQAMIREAIGG